MWSSPDYDDISNQIDFIICLGGDGTLLYASSLFQVRLPASGVLPGRTPSRRVTVVTQSQIELADRLAVEQVCK